MSGGARVVVVGGAVLGAPPGPGDAVAAALGGSGVPVESVVLVEEDEAALEHALAPGAALTVIVAGVGGSSGDVVRRVLARVTGARLVLNERMLAALEDAYRRADRPLPRRAERLALLPQSAVVWSAPGGEPAWLLDTAAGAFVVLPRASALAPPHARQLVEAARARVGPRGATVVRTLRTAGVSLGDVEERLGEWLGASEGRAADVAVSAVPVEGEVWVTLRARGGTVEQARSALGTVEADVRGVLGDDYYGADAETLEQVVGQRLLARGLTLAVAESCTGGLVGHRITNVPGSSAYFERGVVVYSNRAKQELLGVSDAVLRSHGAVSAPCAEAMARGVAAAAGTACGLAITGIAGPDGATPGKPVGTVFIGLAVSGEVTSRRFRFTGDRVAVKWQSAQMALDMLRRRLGGPSA